MCLREALLDDIFLGLNEVTQLLLKFSLESGQCKAMAMQYPECGTVMIRSLMQLLQY